MGSQPRQQVAPAAFIEAIATRNCAEPARAVHGALVGGKIAVVLVAVEQLELLGLDICLRGFLAEARMALLLEPALVCLHIGVIFAARETGIGAASKIAPVVGSAMWSIGIAAIG